MGEAIEDSAGKTLRSEDLGPFVEGQVRGDDDRAALVALRDDLEQEFGPGLGERNEAELVDEEKVLAGEGLLQTLQAAVIDRLDQLVNQSGGGREADLQALLASSQAKAQGSSLAGLLAALSPSHNA